MSPGRRRAVHPSLTPLHRALTQGLIAVAVVALLGGACTGTPSLGTPVSATSPTPGASTSPTPDPTASVAPTSSPGQAVRTPGPLTLPDPTGWIRHPVPPAGVTLASPAKMEILAEASLAAVEARLVKGSFLRLLLGDVAHVVDRVGLVALGPAEPDPMILLVGSTPLDGSGFDGLVAEASASYSTLNKDGIERIPAPWYGPAGSGRLFRINLRSGANDAAVDYQLHEILVDLGDRAAVVVIVGPAQSLLDSRVGNIADRIFASVNVLP